MKVGEFYIGEHRIEYSEYGGGEYGGGEYGDGGSWVVLIHGLLMPRRMHEPLAQSLAAAGHHVVTVDLLGHGTSDRPTDPLSYSMEAFAGQVIALLDHLGANQAVVGGTSLGANVALETAVLAPERIRGLILEMPVLDNALEAGVIAFAPLMLAARFLPFTVNGVAFAARLVPVRRVPFWAGILLDTVNQQAASMGDVLHGIFFGRVAPPSPMRREIDVPALIVGHPSDPIHPAADAGMLAGEMPNARFVRAESILEWRRRPERLNAEAADFVSQCWMPARRRRPARRTAPARRGTPARRAAAK